MDADTFMSMPARAAAALGDFAEELSAVMAERSPERIRQTLAKGSWIYGAGEYGRQLCGGLQEAGFEVLGFVDRRGGEGFGPVMDLPVRHPDELTRAEAEGRALIGAITNPSGGPAEILPFAQSLPFADFLFGADLPDALGPVAHTFWQGTRRFLFDHIDQLKAVCGRLGDQKSLDTVLGVLRYRVTGQTDAHPAVEPDVYIPAEFGGFDGPITFVDGGAFIGDTCADLLAHGVEIARYVAFEPDEKNLGRLIRFAREAQIGETNIIPCGLSDTLKDLSFAGAKGPSSRITADAPAAAEASTIVRCVSLDEMLPGLTPDFIKLDIEGAEMAALKGMRATLERAHPRLAICLYHRPQDLWEIPAYAGQLYDRLYIRQHGPVGWDTVLYALP